MNHMPVYVLLNACMTNVFLERIFGVPSFPSLFCGTAKQFAVTIFEYLIQLNNLEGRENHL